MRWRRVWCSLLSCFVWTSFRQERVDEVWKKALGQTPNETYESLIASFPKQSANDVATKLEALTTRLCIVSSAMPGTPQSQQPGGIFRTWDVPPYLYSQLSAGNDDIAEVPEEISR